MSDSYKQFFKHAQDVRRPEGDRRTPPAPAAKSAAAPTAQQLGRDEQSLRRAMKMNPTPKRKAPVPWKAVAGLSVTLFLGGFYMVSPETFEHALDHIEVRAMGRAEAADDKPAPTNGKAESSTAAAGKTEKTAGADAKPGAGKGPADNASVSGDLSQYEKLKQRKEELDAREKEIAELEEELQRQKVELDKRITTLEEMRAQIAQTLKDRVEVDQEKVNKLVDLYSNMKPKQAADVIASINEELAVEVLAKMKKKSAAEIMNLLPAEKARILSEKYTGYRRISSQEPKG